MSLFHFVVNPAGASGDAARVWERTKARLEREGVSYQVYFSSRDRSIGMIMGDLTSGEETVNVIVLGGDGTFNEAINGVRSFDHLRLGILPCGSGNDLARDLGLPDREAALDIMLRGETVRTTDLGYVRFYNKTASLQEAPVPCDEIRLFNVSCGMGYDAEICVLADRSPLKNVLNRLGIGRLIYLLNGAYLIFRAKKYPVTIIRDDGTEQVYPRCLFAVVMNHRYEGGGVMFCPHADADDGLLDLCAADGQNSVDFFRIVPHTYKGDHLKYAGVYEDRSRSFRLKSGVPLWVHTDGEVFCASGDIETGILEQKLNLLI